MPASFRSLLEETRKISNNLIDLLGRAGESPVDLQASPSLQNDDLQYQSERSNGSIALPADCTNAAEGPLSETDILPAGGTDRTDLPRVSHVVPRTDLPRSDVDDSRRDAPTDSDSAARDSLALFFLEITSQLALIMLINWTWFYDWILTSDGLIVLGVFMETAIVWLKLRRSGAVGLGYGEPELLAVRVGAGVETDGEAILPWCTGAGRRGASMRFLFTEDEREDLLSLLGSLAGHIAKMSYDAQDHQNQKRKDTGPPAGEGGLLVAGRGDEHHQHQKAEPKVAGADQRNKKQRGEELQQMVAEVEIRLSNLLQQWQGISSAPDNNSIHQDDYGPGGPNHAEAEPSGPSSPCAVSQTSSCIKQEFAYPLRFSEDHSEEGTSGAPSTSAATTGTAASSSATCSCLRRIRNLLVFWGGDIVANTALNIYMCDADPLLNQQVTVFVLFAVNVVLRGLKTGDMPFRDLWQDVKDKVRAFSDIAFATTDIASRSGPASSGEQREEVEVES